MKSFKVLLVVVACFLTFLLSVAIIQAGEPAVQLPNQDSVAVSIVPLQDKVGATGPIKFRFTLRNTHQAPLSILKWNTPLDGLNADMFRVTLNGKTVPYIGRLISRLAPRPEDYVTIEPGRTVSAEFDLAKGYEISETGSYEVVYRSNLQDVVAGEVKTVSVNKMNPIYRLRSNIARFELTVARPVIKKEKISSLGQSSNWSSQNCTAGQNGDLVYGGLGYTYNLSQSATTALSSTTEAQRSAAPRYRTWFGYYDAGRYTAVHDNFAKITNTLSSLVFTCEECDDPSWTAYVHHNDEYLVHLCSPFWGLQWTGQNSKAGIIIHETSHFDDVAGTRDHVYGDVLSKDLANYDPDTALNNADNYRLFADNIPPEFMMQPPKITGVYPKSFPCGTGGTITIIGESFYDVKSVEINSGITSPHVPISYNVDSSIQITATIPATLGSGPEDIWVNTAADVTSYKGFSILPIITSISPSSGPVPGGTSVTINGACLGSHIYFGNNEASYGYNVQCANKSQCTVSSPAATTTSVVDVVSDAGGGARSTMNPADKFTYAGPIITGISPSSGPITGGKDIIITGSGFPPYTGTGNNMPVAFGNVQTSALCLGSTVHSTTSCSVVIPAVSQTGPVHIIATAYGASSTPTPADVYTYVDLALKQISCSSTGDCFIELNGQAPAGGAVINLAVNDQNVLSLPGTATIPENSSGTDILLTFLPTSKNEDVTLTATYQGSSVSTTVHINPWPKLTLKMKPQGLNYGESTAVTVSLNTPAPKGGAKILLTSSNSAFVAVPPSVIIPKGSKTATLSLTNNHDGPIRKVTISASYKTAAVSGELSVGCQFQKCPDCGVWDPKNCVCLPAKKCLNGGKPDSDCKCIVCKTIKNPQTGEVIESCY